jgi:predicted nucleic acid-binding protein
MIVADTNILVYLYLPTEYSAQAEDLLQRDPEWAVPALWRSEFRNVLTLYLRRNLLTLEQAEAIQTEAESFLHKNEYLVNSLDVLQLVQQSKCSAYDCEFVALAQSLSVSLITMDRQILADFPAIAKPLHVLPRKQQG